MIIDYLETRNSTQSHGFSLFNNVFVKSNVTLIQKTKKTQTIERKKSLLQVFPSIPSDLIYISRFQLAAEENSTDNFLLVFVFLSEDSDSWATDAEFLLLLKLQFKCLLTLQCALVFLLLPPASVCPLSVESIWRSAARTGWLPAPNLFYLSATRWKEHYGNIVSRLGNTSSSITSWYEGDGSHM